MHPHKFLSWAAVLTFATLFFLGDGQFGMRSLNHLWDLGHLPSFALFAYMLVTRWKKLAASPFITQLIVVTTSMAILGWSIEALQLLVGRTFSMLDLRKDLIGAGLGLVFFAPASKSLSRKSRLGLKLLLIGLLAWEMTPVARALMDESTARNQFPMLSGLETRFERGRWTGNAEHFIDSQVHHEGKASMHVIFGTEAYSGVGMQYFPRDWRGYSFLCLDLFNPEPEPLKVTFRVNDWAHDRRGHHYEDRFNRAYNLSSGWQTIKIPLEEIRDAPATRPMQMQDIESFMLFTTRLPQPRTIYMDGVRLQP